MDARFIDGYNARLMNIFSHPWLGLSINRALDPSIILRSMDDGISSMDERYPPMGCIIYSIMRNVIQLTIR